MAMALSLTRLAAPTAAVAGEAAPGGGRGGQGVVRDALPGRLHVLRDHAVPHRLQLGHPGAGACRVSREGGRGAYVQGWYEVIVGYREVKAICM